MQIGVNGWSQDFLTASNFLQTLFTCPSRAGHPQENLSRFCHRGVARQAVRAVASQGAEVLGRWAAIDRRVVDLAPAVPLTNQRGVVLVSKRVGNVQSHLNWFPLLDRLWVR